MELHGVIEAWTEELMPVVRLMKWVFWGAFIGVLMIAIPTLYIFVSVLL